MNFLLFIMLAFAGSTPYSGQIVAVYDGDTYTLSSGHKIRLRAVNTPELRPKEAFGIEARDAIGRLALNKTVSLTYGSIKQDSYERLLASVSVKNKDFGVYLLEEGLGHLFLIPPEELDVESLKKVQAKAKEERKGIWGHRRYQGTLHITSFHANAPGIDEKNINGEYIRICNIHTEPIQLEGYTMKTLDGRQYTLPKVLVPVGHTVKVHSGKGRNKTNTKKQLEIYLGSNQPIWNNAHDRVTFYDPSGKQEDTRLHKPLKEPEQ